MGGTTIHSWSGLGIRDELSVYDLEEMETKKYLYVYRSYCFILLFYTKTLTMIPFFSFLLSG
jgi:hypothetical protein